MDHSDISPVNSYIPDLIKLAEREYDEDVLVVGYENLSDLENFTDKLDQGMEVKSLIPEIRVALLSLEGQNVENVLKDLESKEKIEGIRYIEPNYTDREIQVIKNDPNVVIEKTGSSALNQVEEGYPDYREFQYALDKINAETAWATATGAGVVVGLLDTGTDGTHPDLVDQLFLGYDPYWNKKIDPNEDSDTDGHGTHTAGIIAAKDDGQGVVGLAPDAKIMPIRIFNPNYVGDYAVAAGIVWAVENGADVLSNSWGGGYSNILKDAFDYALTNDVVVVASSGNFTTDQHWFYPSGFPGVIAVAASDDKDNIAYFSSRGDYVSVSAPGVDIISTIPVELGEYEGIDGNPYIRWSGTSMPAPYVSALAALIKEKYPEANVYQIRKMIEDGALDIDEDGYDTSAGYGRISSASLNLNPTDYEAGNLVVKAISKRSSNPLPGVFITLESKETSKRYYGKTSNDGTELFAGIEPGDYEIIIGGPEYLYYYAPNYRMEEELSYSGNVEVGHETIYTQEFETTQFKAVLTTDLPFNGTLTISLLDGGGNTIETFELPSNEEISIDLLQHIIESGHYYLSYEYVGTIPEGEFGIRGEIQINNESIPVEISINQEGMGFIDEYGGDRIPWTIF
ncbi:S8 family serine peptidase [Petrotoga sibirica]|uniref:Subtilisin family serine protease n=2 Tax=Petrotogaceae TaxID=1643949 RepID=A0A4R8ETF7_9BACT|nr:S8 family serine peptidase [Petrotoga sibirica]TDX15599.1 subtilisin family serine protease [Petrotoga sibirica]